MGFFGLPVIEAYREADWLGEGTVEGWPVGGWGLGIGAARGWLAGERGHDRRERTDHQGIEHLPPGDWCAS